MMVSLSFFFVILVLSVQIQSIHCEDPWRFINLADYHGGEEFVSFPVRNIYQFNNMDGRTLDKFLSVKAMYETYGGELITIPGDTNSGHWYQDKFLTKLDVKNSKQAIRKAGAMSYESLKFFFEQAGYNKLLVAVGDHELGGNAWPDDAYKTSLLTNFRQAMAKGLHSDSDGNFLYQEPIGKVPSQPLGTIYEDTSFATQHKNVLFITVDAFQKRNKDFFNKKEGLGGEGSVTGTVVGDHLSWFIQVLKHARYNKSIDHIIVQAHLPILQPVRKAYCSGQFMDHAEESLFWQAMRDYNVDLYLAGEVHSNTATKDDASDLVQIVSRGNSGSNFMTIDVTDKTLILTSYRDAGTEWKFNTEYEEQGRLVIDKTDDSTTTFEGEGNLQLINREEPMIHLTFDRKVPLLQRQMTVLKHDAYKSTRIQTSVTIRGVKCFDSFINSGEYGQDYDALTANVKQDNFDSIKGQSAVLTSPSARIAIDGLGPHSGGHPVSYALWFKTKMQNVHLIHYGKIFGGGDGDYKNFIFSLTLDSGRPALWASDTTRLIVDDPNMNLSKNKWQHVAISMPNKSCLLSQVKIWVNGELVNTKVKGKDHNIFFFTAGRVSVGSLGRSGDELDSVLRDPKNFKGKIDEVYVWARPIKQKDINKLLRARK